ncbi:MULTISPECIES: hypothetical protein [Bacillus cereus group]|uniref:hypothetical protein n=1 Tax=Bacillus cereus group TaxID=86661 RepID=UPI0015D4A298|nr:hypothetical protein [Bacillus thuringiensis]
MSKPYIITINTVNEVLFFFQLPMLLRLYGPTLISNWKKSKRPSLFAQRELQLNVKPRNSSSSNLQPSPPVMTIHFRL